MRAVFISIFLSLAATFGHAQDAVPEQRIAISRDYDLPGGDLQNIFDTTLDACQAACLADTRCDAFTFNARSNSCFPKSQPTDAQPYAGAISGRVYQTDPKVLAIAPSRAADLSFLRDDDLTRARALAEQMGQLYPTDEMPLANLLANVRDRRESGDVVGQLIAVATVVPVTDTADLWVEYARLARSLSSGRYSVVDAARGRATAAAINGYLRSTDDGGRVNALIELALWLEENGRGRAMIPALRLAQDIQPRRDTEEMLTVAIGKYGFNVTDTTVESDSATPRICALFSEPLVRAGVDYTPYVQLPDPKLTVEVNDSQLCIDGVTHGERYRIVLREGLPAASGEKLVRPIPLTLYVRDRSPAVRFVSNGYVVPATGDVAVPIETVNIDTIDLSLRRMTDRNLIRTMQDDLFSRPLYEYNQYILSDQVAEDIWSGTVTVGRDLNRDVLSRIPMTEALSGQPSGIYILSAGIPGADPYDNPPATQWFIVSDLGIATYLGTDGLTVAVRGLGDAATRDGASVTLLSEGNAVLGTATTGPDGTAKFEAGLTRGLGVARPALVTVGLGDDMAFLSLRDAAFDLSDRGVEGREPAGPLDVFLATDRGAYRAGEVIHVTALMRDANALAVPGVPLTAVLRRPDGVEYSRIASAQSVAGGHVFALPVAGTAPRGTWTIALFADVDAPPLATETVLVEDFVPERIDFEQTLSPDIRLGERPILSIQANYLFGPPAGDLAIEGEALLRAASSIPGFEGYQFGRYDDPFAAQLSYLEGGRTQADGSASLSIDLPAVTDPGRPLELRVTTRLSEGSGRPVERQITGPVLPGGPMIGIKPLFDGVVGEGSDAQFALIGLSADLTPQPMTVEWTVNRVSTNYQWYSNGGNWNWEPLTTRERIATGTAVLDGTPVSISAPTNWGEYEVVVERTDGAYVASSTSFYAGWYAPAEAESTPDLLEASLDAPSYAVGDTAKFRIVPRYAGTAVVTVMSNHLIHMETVEVAEGENLIPLTVTEEWGAGAYVSATVIRPMDVAAGRNPTRSLGLGYAAVDPGQKALTVGVAWNTDVRPRGPLDVTVSVNGIKDGEQAYVTLAAVDVGILNLTAFQSPDPQRYYFGQQKLGVEMRDVYGRLIDGMNGAMGTVRSGGDAMAQMGLQSPPPTEELVAYFSGPVAVGADGKAVFAFDLPAFNGTVRLMAIAWSDTGVGSADEDVIVRDPVVVTASLPRFLAPDDQSRLLLDIVHTEGPTGAAGLSVTADGLALSQQSIPAQIMLTAGGKTSITIPFAAVEPGDHRITVSLTLPDGKTLDKVLTVPVRMNDPEVSRMSRFTLAAGDTFVFDDNVFAGLQAGTGSATLSAGPLARFDGPGLLNALDRYPYGCTEQITSKAMPLLYLNQVATAMGLGTRDTLDKRIDEAILAVLGNQDANGAFGLWGPYSGDLWLDAYVTDFLSRARATGHPVPDVAFLNAIDNLRNRVNYYPDFGNGGEDLAYALMVLAREGAASIGDLRYYADERGEAFATSLAYAQLGAALAYYGDQTRADQLFSAAGGLVERTFSRDEAAVWRIDYGTNRRDAAAVLALAAEAGSTAVDRDSIVRWIAADSRNMSTQEATWTLLAANSLVRDFGEAGVTIDGVLQTGPIVQLRDAQTASGPVRIANTGTAPIDMTVTTFGVPSEPEPAGGNGYDIKRAYYTMDGVSVDLSDVAVGTRLVSVLTVQPFGKQEARLMVNDPLPAGFEIDNPNLLQGGDIGALGWLDPVRGQNAEFRTDRFLAAVDWRSDQPFQLAYIVRAVSPGTFHQPAASVEDMYRPQMRARTDAGQLVIRE